MIQRKSVREMALMHAVGKILGNVFKELGKNIVKLGISTGEIDEEIRRMIEEQGAVPAFKGYRGFPGNSCISVDEEVVHGIPRSRWLKEGQIVGIDIGVQKDGYFSDAARTYPVGEISLEKQRLLDITQASLMAGIEKARAGNRLHDISSAVQEVVENAGFSVVRSLVGHGIGQDLHEPPEIPNFGTSNTGPRLREGMVFAIEPMVNMGGYHVITKEDEWTVVTADGSPSAHFEHTVAITDGEPQILTLGE